MSDALHPQLQRCYDLAIQWSWKHPFFMIPLGAVQWYEGNPERIKTMAVHSRILGKGKDATPEIGLHINTEWCKTLPDDQVFGVLCHEIMHSLLRHHERWGGKNQKLWGQATDMAINSALIQSGIKLPEYALKPPSGYEDSSAEEIYTLLEAEEIEQPKNYDPGKVGAGCSPERSDPSDNPGEGEGGDESEEPGKGSGEPGDGQGDGDGNGEGDQESDGSGNGSGSGDEGDNDGEGQGSGSDEGQSSDRVWGEMVAQAQSMGRGTGAAKVMARVFTPKPTKTKWDRLLRSAAARASARGGRDNQTFKRVNRRSTDIIMPGWESNRPSIAAIIDSSGSVSDEMLRSALTSVKECARISGVRIFLAVHAYSCYYADWIRPETTVEQISKLCTDRGGTDPNEAFERVGEARGKFDQCVYLTDGEVGAYPEKPKTVRNMIVGILGNRPSTYRSQIPDGWREVGVEIDL